MRLIAGCRDCATGARSGSRAAAGRGARSQGTDVRVRCLSLVLCWLLMMAAAAMESADHLVPKEDSCPASENAGSVRSVNRKTCVISNAIRKRVRSEYYRIRQNKRQERSVLVKVCFVCQPVSLFLKHIL